jgi:CubicO group peptidase (beta-lactamase class C family)
MIKHGEIYVKKGNRILLHESHGYRDLANEIKNNEKTIYPTASLGKVFVAVAILKLIEEKRIDLSTTLRKAIPYDLGKIDLETTIKELLTHTSNVPDYFDEEHMDDYAMLWHDLPNYRIRHARELLPLFIHKTTRYEKGTFNYNNSGFVLLGLVIEAITNMPFDDFIKKVVFDPAGMKRTGYFELDRLPKNTANAYLFDAKNQSYYQNIYSVDVKGTGAGGAFTNAHDLSMFWEALLGGKLIEDDLVRLMMKPHVHDNNTRYGLGVWLDERGAPLVMGEDPGVTCISSHDPKTGLEITIISNMGEDVFRLHHEIKELD